MKWAATLALVAAAFGLVLIEEAGSCPVGWVDFSVDPMSPVCLKFVMYGKGTWYSLRGLCQAEGADLAELRGELHHQVYEYIMDHQDLQDEGFWIGGTDEGHEGSWTWVSDNSPMPMGVPHWYPCHPAQPDGGTSSNYACIYTPDFYFHSCKNDIKIYAICQI
ncbi:putative C-type lectin-like 31 [Homarus americanus]|uniref:C-type lectin-2 n=2 Tax=Decapoda TaxID=6683 RepID=E9LXE7_PENVA|nr:C-type lectin-2 [Penaeus vannamei]KAG7175165.1 putative C-type lectin-like 31 [Homarus americanus]